MGYAYQRHKISIRQACILFCLQQSVYFYKPQPRDDGQIRDKLAELAEVHCRWGFWMMHHHLRSLNHTWNHKRVYRVYTEMGLNLRRKRKKRLPARVMEPLTQPAHPNTTWSMDFMHDTLNNGIRFRSFNIIDDYNREALNITIDTSLPSRRVIRELERLIAWRGTPGKIRVDNGPEFIANALETWADNLGIDLKHIEKGKPYQNGYVERFNRTYREEVLDAYSFSSLKEAQALSNVWMWVYNNERPHKSLGYKSPTRYLQDQLMEYPTFINDKQNDWKTLILSATN